jgi:hypothetical protein
MTAHHTSETLISYQLTVNDDWYPPVRLVRWPVRHCFVYNVRTLCQQLPRHSEVTDPDFVNNALEKSMLASMNTSYSRMPAIEKLEAGKYVAFVIQPVQVRMAVYARPDPGEYTELFETVEGSELR